MHSLFVCDYYYYTFCILPNSTVDSYCSCCEVLVANPDIYIYICIFKFLSYIHIFKTFVISGTILSTSSLMMWLERYAIVFVV